VLPRLFRAILESDVRLRWRRTMLIAVLAAASLAAGRMYFGPIRERGPVGTCIEGAIDLNNPAPFAEARFSGTILGLAASGGGSRAAYLEAAVLREIRAAGSTLHLGLPSGRSLLDQIDAISSVSGGSLAAAYYAINAPRLNAADADSGDWSAFLEAMARSYRTRQWFGSLAWHPATWFRYAITDFNRGVLAREDYDALLYRGARLSDLPDRPALYLNAFDVANHVRFVLTKHYVDTAYLQPRSWWGRLGAPQTLLSANDLTFTRIDPASVRLTEAVYASSAFPLAYPNLPLKHCGQKILFQGGQIFLSDGALADNSGLITLMTQLRRWLDPRARGSTVVAIYIDASVDRIDNNGSKFQQMGVEDDYAWRDTIVGHGIEATFGIVALMQDLAWKAVEGMDVVTDQLNMNWPGELVKRDAACAPPERSTWTRLHQTGALAMRPLVMRLGLRDVVNPDFAAQFGTGLADRARLTELLEKAGVENGLTQLPRELSRRLQIIPTDFTLSERDRKLLDLVAFLLVQGKLSGDIALWNHIYRSVRDSSPAGNTCG
jgi:predicted acylesterase/phospholipase RssA